MHLPRSRVGLWLSGSYVLLSVVSAIWNFPCISSRLLGIDLPPTCFLFAPWRSVWYFFGFHRFTEGLLLYGIDMGEEIGLFRRAMIYVPEFVVAILINTVILYWIGASIEKIIGKLFQNRKESEVM